jgi:cytochrome P450
MKSMPPWLVKILSPPMMQLVIYTKVCLYITYLLPYTNIFVQDQEQQVRSIKDGRHLDEVKQTRRTIIHELFESSLPESEKSVARIAQEAQTLVAAGSATTSFFLKSAVYFILANPNVLARLRTELKEAIPDPKNPPPSHKIEQLPFLTAIVKETGRLVPGAFCRLGRIAPNEDLKCGTWTIPAGTTVSMSTWIQHNDPTIFPEPETFRPERWMNRDADGGRLERYLVPFSKGSRGCLGINLAQVEMYLTLAVLFRTFDFELFETDESDVALAHEFFVPISRLDSKGMRVLAKTMHD